MKQEAPAAARNREPITAVLAEELPARGTILEIASGTGEHVVHFARMFPHLDWQPSDPSPEARSSIAAWSEEAQLTNIAPPLAIDAASDTWPAARCDALLCINMVHISEWEASVGLFRAGSRVLTSNAPLILYGPFLELEVTTAPSNLAFDRSLKERNPEWGLRNLADMDCLADQFGFSRTNRYEMPANNLMLIYRRHLA